MEKSSKILTLFALIFIFVFSLNPIADEVTAIAENETATRFEQFLPVIFFPIWVLSLISLCFGVFKVAFGL